MIKVYSLEKKKNTINIVYNRIINRIQKKPKEIGLLYHNHPVDFSLLSRWIFKPDKLWMLFLVVTLLPCMINLDIYKKETNYSVTNLIFFYKESAPSNPNSSPTLLPHPKPPTHCHIKFSSSFILINFGEGCILPSPLKNWWFIGIYFF